MLYLDCERETGKLTGAEQRRKNGNKTRKQKAVNH